MKAKKTLINLRVNFGYDKGSKTQEPDYLIRRAKGFPRRVEIGRISRVGVEITLILK